MRPPYKCKRCGVVYPFDGIHNCRWWLVPGVIVESIDDNTSLHRIWYNDKGESYWLNHIKRKGIELLFRPVGVPFDCLPEWAEEICFYEDGSFHFIKRKTILSEWICLPNGIQTIPFHTCPDEWKGKTFEIIDELRELIRG